MPEIRHDAPRAPRQGLRLVLQHVLKAFLWVSTRCLLAVLVISVMVFVGCVAGMVMVAILRLIEMIFSGGMPAFGMARAPYEYNRALEGLPVEATEDDILDGFASVSGASIFRADNVKSVRLRNNKKGRRIGFVEFYEVLDASAFLDYHYPAITIQLAHSRGMGSEPVTLGLNYSRERENEGREASARDNDEWECPECAHLNSSERRRCSRCRTERHDTYGVGGLRLSLRPNGETDECPQQFPSQYLVIRGLDPSTSEEALAEGLSKLYIENTPSTKKDTSTKLKSTAPTANVASIGARPSSLRRVFIMRDRRTREPLRYGFAEYSTLEDAQAAVAKFRITPNLVISGRSVTVAFIHNGVFVPFTKEATPRVEPFLFKPVYNPNVYLKYWDDRAYPSILDVSVDPTEHAGPDEAGGQSRPHSPERAATEDAIASHDASGKKVKRFKLSAAPSKTGPVMGPQVQMWAKKRAELVGGREGERGDEAAPEPALNTEKTRPRKPRNTAHDSRLSFADRDGLTCMLCMRRFKSDTELREHEVHSPAHLAHAADEARRHQAAARLAEKGLRAETIVMRRRRDPYEVAPAYLSYADQEKLECHVCRRKFPNAAVLSLHERESELHLENLEGKENIERAVAALASTGKKPAQMRPRPSSAQAQQYRDRARERRKAHSYARKAAAPGPKQQQQRQTEEAKPAAPSKGAALLSKMGWTAGSGLGAEGTGRTEAIATDVYAAGVGLGAEGGKLGDAAAEAARRTTENYTDFVEKTKDKARERFVRLG